MDDDSAPVVALTRKRHVNYPILMGDEQIGTAYGGILGLPVTFLIDRQGNIAARYKGETSLAAMRARSPAPAPCSRYPIGGTPVLLPSLIP